jgi:hypothetical protein
MTDSFVVRGFYSLDMDALRGVSTGAAAVERRVSALPDGVATLRPGPQLAALLATADRSTVTAEELPDLVKSPIRSDRDNCHCLCKRHHGIRHRNGFQVTKHGQTTTWTTRNGRAYHVTPANDINLSEEH